MKLRITINSYEVRVMAKAFILINSEIGQEDILNNELKKIEHVREVYQVYGGYDFVVKVDAPNVQELKDLVSVQIRRLKQIRSTLTMMVMEES
jgi:DNA-binding Lrp family transcriptional regulator